MKITKKKSQKRNKTRQELNNENKVFTEPMTYVPNLSDKKLSGQCKTVLVHKPPHVLCM